MSVIFVNSEEIIFDGINRLFGYRSFCRVISTSKCLEFLELRTACPDWSNTIVGINLIFHSRLYDFLEYGFTFWFIFFFWWTKRYNLRFCLFLLINPRRFVIIFLERIYMLLIIILDVILVLKRDNLCINIFRFLILNCDIIYFLIHSFDYSWFISVILLADTWPFAIILIGHLGLLDLLFIRYFFE